MNNKFIRIPEIDSKKIKEWDTCVRKVISMFTIHLVNGKSLSIRYNMKVNIKN